MSGRDGGARLGRGLAALLGEPIPDQADAPTAPPRTVAIERLEPGPFQPRGPIEPEDLGELTESIRSNGILQPLLLRPYPGREGYYQIIAGERRWRAAQAAGLHELPALVRDLGDSEAMAAALVENLQRQDLNAIEEAEGYKRLVDEFHLTQEALASAVGKSRSHVANLMRLLHLPEFVRGELRRGALSAGHARALLAHPEPDRAARAVVARGLNVRQTEALAQRGAAAPERRAENERDPETDAIERDLSERLGLRVSLSFDGRGGTVKIAYRSLEQLDGIIALLSR